MSDDDSSGIHGLSRILLEHKPVFDVHLSTCRQPLSDYTFANTLIWRESINLRWKILRDCLCVFANGDGGLTLLFPPMGEGDVARAAREALVLCEDHIARHRPGMTACIEYVSDEMLSRLGGAFEAQPMSADYVYPTARMIDLAGGDLASKRHARNRFARRCDARTEPFESRHVEPCIELLKTWKQQSGHGDVEEVATSFKRCKDVLATCEAMRHCDALGLRGMVLYAGDRIVGFTFGEHLGGRDACNILIEKTDREYAGSAQYIFSEFCRQYWSDTQHCNVGDDWDIPSLAWTKQSYRPSHRLAKWVVRAVPAVTVTVGSLDDGSAASAADGLSRATLADLDRLHALERLCFDASVAISRRQYRYLLQRPRVDVRVLRASGEIVASALVLRRRTRSGVVGRLYSLAVDPAHRGRGLGKTLLTHCLDVLRAEGVVTVYLEVAAENTAAIRLYEQQGFRQLRWLRNYYGEGSDGWKMGLRLKETPVEPVASALLPVGAR